MIKVNNSLYINEDVIAMVTRDHKTKEVVVVFKDPITWVEGNSSAFEEPLDEDEVTQITSVTFSDEYSEEFFRSLDLISIGGEEEYEDLYWVSSEDTH